MALRKTLRDLVVENAARFRQGVRATFGDESSDEVSVRFDGTALVIEDETNNAEQLRLPLDEDVADQLAESGAHALAIRRMLDFDPHEVTIDTRANRPAAGTADRVYVETDADGRILRDDGGAWDVLGTSPAAITEGGVSEIDASEFDGSAGTDGQVLQTNGTSVSWASAQGVGADDVLAYDFVMD
jgi:hypothetical protein